MDVDIDIISTNSPVQDATSPEIPPARNAARTPHDEPDMTEAIAAVQQRVWAGRTRAVRVEDAEDEEEDEQLRDGASSEDELDPRERDDETYEAISAWDRIREIIERKGGKSGALSDQVYMNTISNYEQSRLLRKKISTTYDPLRSRSPRTWRAVHSLNWTRRSLPLMSQAGSHVNNMSQISPASSPRRTTAASTLVAALLVRMHKQPTVRSARRLVTMRTESGVSNLFISPSSQG